MSVSRNDHESAKLSWTDPVLGDDSSRCVVTRIVKVRGETGGGKV